jgi:hypothetical protein
MKKNKGNGRRGTKRRKNEEKRARRVREKIRRRAHEKKERRRRIEVVRKRVEKAAALSRDGVALRADSGDRGICARKDGIGRLSFSESPTFQLHYPWAEIYPILLSSLERAEWVPYDPKSPLERLAECGS